MTAQVTKAKAAIANPWWVIALICIPVFIGSLDLTIVSAFLPELIVDLEIPLQTGLDDAAWILSAYLLAYTISLAVMGRISDLVGRRSVFVVCLVIFIIGSILVAEAHLFPTDILYGIYRRLGQRPDLPYVNFQAIILGRVVQALGAGALVPVALALVGDLFPPDRRARPLGLIGAVDTLGWVLGHLYGGIFVQVIPWQGLFWVNVPLSLLAMFATLYALRGVPQRKAVGRFDLLGAGLLIGALIGLNIGLGANIEVSAATSLDSLKPLPDYALPLLGSAGVFFLLFILVETRVRDPLIDLRMFRNRNVSAGALTNLFVGYCLFIGLVIVPILVNVRQEVSMDGVGGALRDAALQTGLLLSALTIPMAMAAIPGGWLSERIGNRNTTVIGLSLALVGFILIRLTWTLTISDPAIIGQMVLIGVGLGLTFSPISGAVINAVRDDERGVASALVIVLRLIGMTLSVSSLTTFALQRVTVTVAGELGSAALDPLQYPEVYARVTVGVLGELGLIGAVLCGVALIPALLMTRGSFLEGAIPQLGDDKMAQNGYSERVQEGVYPSEITQK
ncbi:MAG: MFS transporter [Armatimonadetes bacterium]|nr:MFS transporter [Anaerolineae bacterium]